MSISYVARGHGLSPSLVFRWRRLMSEGGEEAARVDEGVVAASEVRRLEERFRELERLLGRKTMEVEILKEAVVALLSEQTHRIIESGARVSQIGRKRERIVTHSHREGRHG
jgi:transposase-like protein